MLNRVPAAKYVREEHEKYMRRTHVMHVSEQPKLSCTYIRFFIESALRWFGELINILIILPVVEVRCGW